MSLSRQLTKLKKCLIIKWKKKTVAFLKHDFQELKIKVTTSSNAQVSVRIWAGSSSTVVEHLPYIFKVKGLRPASTPCWHLAREKMTRKGLWWQLARQLCTVVEPLPLNHRVEGLSPTTDTTTFTEREQKQWVIIYEIEIGRVAPAQWYNPHLTITR